MKTIGIICEYNPMHNGHIHHINESKRLIGDDSAVVCVMSGNFVQRGDFAVFNKQARAEMAVLNGADLVVELPLPYVLQSAAGFAEAGVYILDSLGICDFLSFGSEAGDINTLSYAAEVISSDKANEITKKRLSGGISYPAAQQAAANELMGNDADIFSFPNNVLAIEYIKAINKLFSKLKPLTIKRFGGRHDGDSGYSASFIRNQIRQKNIPASLTGESVAKICDDEIKNGRGPVFMDKAEMSLMSRLRYFDDFESLPGLSEGLEYRIKRFLKKEPTVDSILTKVKTKRYTMARLRRILLCAVLGIKKEHTQKPPPYARILAFNETGKKLLKSSRQKTKIPVLIKPASVNKLNEFAALLFNLEAAATDFYSLIYQDKDERKGGQEWQSPIIY